MRIHHGFSIFIAVLAQDRLPLHSITLFGISKLLVELVWCYAIPQIALTGFTTVLAVHHGANTTP